MQMNRLLLWGTCFTVLEFSGMTDTSTVGRRWNSVPGGIGYGLPWGSFQSLLLPGSCLAQRKLYGVFKEISYWTINFLLTLWLSTIWFLLTHWAALPSLNMLPHLVSLFAGEAPFADRSRQLYVVPSCFSCLRRRGNSLHRSARFSLSPCKEQWWDSSRQVEDCKIADWSHERCSICKSIF